MQLEDFAHIVESRRGFDETVVSALRAVESKGWTVLAIHDMRERLAAKGFEQRPLKIVEICSGKHADLFLSKNRMISLCMPCKINILEENGKVKIAGMNPAIMPQFFPEVSQQDADKVAEDVRKIIEMSQ